MCIRTEGSSSSFEFQFLKCTLISSYIFLASSNSNHMSTKFFAVSNFSHQICYNKEITPIPQFNGQKGRRFSLEKLIICV